jgi:cytochrome c5
MVSPMTRERRAFLLACAILGASSAFLLEARPAQVAAAAGPQATDAGPFTAAQAAAGRLVYDASCASCHGADLGGAAAPPLAGPVFAGSWRTRSTSDLLSVVQTMPPGQAGNFPPETFINVTAFLLQANGRVAGAQPLTASTAVRPRTPRRRPPGGVRHRPVAVADRQLPRPLAGAGRPSRQSPG